MQEIRDLLRQGDPVKLLTYLAVLPASLHQLPWEKYRGKVGGLRSSCGAGYDAAEVDQFLGKFRAAVEQALDADTAAVRSQLK